MLPAARPAWRQTIQPATAIMMNRIVQTTGKAHLGGTQLGLRRPSYQAPGLKMAPLEAARVQSTKKPMRASRSFQAMIVLRCTR